MKKIDDQDILNALQKIEHHATFSASERNVHILRFLVECYIEGVPLKESILEIELFGDKAQSVSYDGKVRVYMFNLRKKLEEYYRGDGAKDKIRFEIKKGQYNLSVSPVRAASEPKRPLPNYLFPSIALILLLAFINKDKLSPSYCWKPFFTSDTPTTCCVGDHFIVVGKSDKNERLTSYFGNVNSERDFEAFIKTETGQNGHYSMAPFSFVTKMGPVSTSKLTAWFAKHNSEMSVMVESEMSVEEINHSNIIYVGPFRTMDLLSSLFLKDSKQFEYNGSEILFSDSEEQIVHFKKQSHSNDNSRQDLVMVSYDTLNDTGNSILYFAGNNDIGVLAAVKNFTNKQWLKDFYRKLPSKNSRFNAAFMVSGVGRTELACELIQVEILD